MKRIKQLLVGLICLTVSMICSCDNETDNPDDNDQKGPNNNAVSAEIIITSSAIADNSGERSLDISNEDWYFSSEGIIWLKVVNVRGKLHSLSFVGDLQGPISTEGHLELLSNQSLFFDLSESNILTSIDDAQIHHYGELNKIILGLLYLEMDVQFKGDESTFRFYWSDDEESEAKGGDILVKSDGQFRWVDPLDQNILFETRPAGLNDVVRVRNGGVPDDDEWDDAVFDIDTYSNIEFMNNPFPWERPEEYDNEGSDFDIGGRLDPFYEITSSTVAHNLIITLDLSFVGAASFKNEVTKNDETTIYWNFEERIDDETDEPYDVITDLEGNDISADEFDFMDIFPCIAYPGISGHVTVEE